MLKEEVESSELRAEGGFGLAVRRKDTFCSGGGVKAIGNSVGEGGGDRMIFENTWARRFSSMRREKYLRGTGGSLNDRILYTTKK